MHWGVAVEATRVGTRAKRVIGSEERIVTVFFFCCWFLSGAKRAEAGSKPRCAATRRARYSFRVPVPTDGSKGVACDLVAASAALLLQNLALAPESKKRSLPFSEDDEDKRCKIVGRSCNFFRKWGWAWALAWVVLLRRSDVLGYLYNLRLRNLSFRLPSGNRS